MSATRLEGGPLDGAEISPHRESFIFVQPMMEGRPRVFSQAKPGRLLYRYVGRSYLFAGHTHAPCGGCGAFMDLGEGEAIARCDLCGGEVRRVPSRA